MMTRTDPATAACPRLVWDRDQFPAEPDSTDAALEAGAARAILAMEQLVATIRQSGYATESRQITIELALTKIDEQMMHATRALFSLPTEPLSVSPLLRR